MLWKILVKFIEPYWPWSKTGRLQFAIETMLRIHRMQQWFGLSNPAMETGAKAVIEAPIAMKSDRKPPASLADHVIRAAKCRSTCCAGLP